VPAAVSSKASVKVLSRLTEIPIPGKIVAFVLQGVQEVEAREATGSKRRNEDELDAECSGREKKARVE
jgi:hypothetical protein